MLASNEARAPGARRQALAAVSPEAAAAYDTR